MHSETLQANVTDVRSVGFTRDIAIERASLPPQIRGFAPVKRAAALALRRAELRAAFDVGGWPKVRAAE